jgi:hypothetical protein
MFVDRSLFLVIPDLRKHLRTAVKELTAGIEQHRGLIEVPGSISRQGRFSLPPAAQVPQDYLASVASTGVSPTTGKKTFGLNWLKSGHTKGNLVCGGGSPLGGVSCGQVATARQKR